jgi:hypothetical protein
LERDISTSVLVDVLYQTLTLLKGKVDVEIALEAIYELVRLEEP